jgi:hypothetical protein
MTLKHLPMGSGSLDLTVADARDEQRRRRDYTITSRMQNDVTVTLNCLLPLADVESHQVNDEPAPAHVSEVFSQTLVTTKTSLPPGGTLHVSVTYRCRDAAPVTVDLKSFKPTKPSFENSDVVIFTASRPVPNRTLLRDELARSHKVVPIDGTLPTDPETFEAALLTADGLRTKLLILGERTMACAQRKHTFWWDPRFDELVGEFLRRGGAVLEINSGNPASKWLERTLAPASFRVDYARGADAIALNAPDNELDAQFQWLDEKQAEACGKWSGYWAGNYTLQYLGGGPTITDRALIWGEQEQPHGCMQYTMKTVPGKDHLIRIRTWPWPKKGFTLQVREKDEPTWKVIETVWVPQPKERSENGWLDVYMTLPAKYVTEEQTVFRIGHPEGSGGGIGYPGHSSTGAARIWIRDNLRTPPSPSAINTSSALATTLRLPDKGVTAHSSGRIAFEGFLAPYRILGESRKAALIVRPIGQGLYAKCELTSQFPAGRMAMFAEALMYRSVHKALAEAIRSESR